MDQRPPSIVLSALRGWTSLQGVVWGMVFASLVLLPVRADSPEWWSTRDVINGEAADDYAVINQGQLKTLAAAAVAEMNQKLPLGAGQALNALVASWSDSSISRDDYAAVNVGQLKALAAKFYDRLGQPYPWADSTLPANDYALANSGQAKALFSFSIQFDPPPDWFYWLAQEGLPANTPLNARSDPNGPTNWEKFKQATQDGDGDGSPDVNEIANRTNPTEKDNPAVSLVAYAYALP